DVTAEIDRLRTGRAQLERARTEIPPLRARAVEARSQLQVAAAALEQAEGDAALAALSAADLSAVRDRHDAAAAALASAGAELQRAQRTVDRRVDAVPRNEVRIREPLRAALRQRQCDLVLQLGKSLVAIVPLNEDLAENAAAAESAFPWEFEGQHEGR